MSAIEKYYLGQANGLSHFAGPSVQHGHGLGGIFSSLFRAAVPLLSKAAPVLKSAAKAVAREAVRTGVNVLDDVMDGSSVSDALSHRGQEAAKRVARKGVKRLKRMVNTPKGIKRKRIVHRDIFTP